MLSKKLAAIAALSLVTASTAAAAQSAQPLSLANGPAAASRTGANVDGANSLDDRNGVGIYIIGAVVLGLIIWGIIELTSGSDSP